MGTKCTHPALLTAKRAACTTAQPGNTATNRNWTGGKLPPCINFGSVTRCISSQHTSHTGRLYISSNTLSWVNAYARVPAMAPGGYSIATHRPHPWRRFYWFPPWKNTSADSASSIHTQSNLRSNCGADLGATDTDAGTVNT